MGWDKCVHGAATKGGVTMCYTSSKYSSQLELLHYQYFFAWRDMGWDKCVHAASLLQSKGSQCDIAKKFALNPKRYNFVR